VGGSSRIPLVAQLVSAAFDRPVAVDADPKNAIALGAALSISPRPESWPAANIPPVAPVRPAPPSPVPATHAAPTTPGSPIADPPRPPVPSLAPDLPPSPALTGARRPVVVFGAGGLLVAAAIAAALMYAPENPGPAPTGGTTTSVVQAPQLTQAPAPENAAPAAVEEQGGNAARPQNQGGAARPQNQGERPPSGDEDTGEDNEPPTTTTTPPTTTPTSTTTTTTTATSDPPPIGQGTGDTAPVDGQAGNGVSSPQVPIEEASNGEAEPTGSG
jgi:hypothetical protein